MSIYFVQEAHCTENNMHDWRAEWGYQALFSCRSSKKARVGMLFNNNFSFQISKTYSDDQTGFIKDRFIGENIRLIDSVMKFTASRNIPGLLLFLDFEKAFDTLE